MTRYRYIHAARWQGYIIGWYVGNRGFLFDALTDRAIKKSGGKTRGKK